MKPPRVTMTNSVCNSDRDSTSHLGQLRNGTGILTRDASMGHLVGAISIEDLVLVAQNARAPDDAASVVGFHAVGCVERRGRGLGSLSSFRDGVDPSGCPAVGGPDRRRRCEIHDCLGAGASEGPSSFIPTFGGITGTDPRYGNRSRRRTFLAFSTVIVR